MTKTNLLSRHLNALAIRLTCAVAVLTMASSMMFPTVGTHSATTGIVESRLMAAEAESGHSVPLANSLAANFADSAITVRHWSKTELSVHVTASENDDKTPEQVVELVREGLSLWNGRFKTINLTLTDSADADIQIGFVAPGSIGGGAVGKTDVQFNPESNEIGHASIHIDERLSKAKLVQAVGHEMGHALGIQGHSSNKNDIMYPYAHLPVNVTDRDLNTLSMGYSSSGNEIAAVR